jgi:hypothetical protein
MSQPPNNSLQTTADGAFNLTIESLVFKCRSSAVFEVGRSAAYGMKSLAFMLLAVLSFAGLCSASEPLPASKVTWKEHFGQSGVETNTLFCLMAHGYFRSETTNMQAVVDAWLKTHPKAVVVTVVSGGPVYTDFPNSKQAFVWVVQGSDSLNAELVRKGCLAPETQMLNPHEQPQVPKVDYDAFVRKVTEAAAQAKAHKAGIWREKQK